MRPHDALPTLAQRVRADDDYRAALACRRIAHRDLRFNNRFGFRLEMKAAIRAWQRYAKAVRSIAQ